MLKIISCDNLNYASKLKKYLEKDVLKSKKRIEIVRNIITAVKEGGDKALIKFTNKYENNNFKTIKEIQVSDVLINNSYKHCSKNFKKKWKTNNFNTIYL